MNNKTIMAIVLTLTIAMALLTTFAPSVHAYEMPTYAYIAVSPSTVGKGQTVVVTFWLTIPPPGALGPLGPRWEGYKLTVTRPDGSEENFGPYTSDAVGTKYILYTPTMTGIYYFQFSFPGQTIGNVYYKPSQSPKVALTVQEEPIQAWPPAELPTSYWERPIYGENREWWTIAGNWLMPAYNYHIVAPSGRYSFAPYTQAPNSPHIIWTKELTFGGIVGGELGDKTYYAGLSYQYKLYPPVIISGRLYYNIYPYSWLGVEGPGFVCVDLRTGEELWRKPGTIDFGQICDVENPNMHGCMAFLWGVEPPGISWKLYDAFTGDLILELVNATPAGRAALTGGATVFGPHGELLVYILSGAGNWLAMWNSTKAIPPPIEVAKKRGVSPLLWDTFNWWWDPYAYFGQKLDWRQGIQWNVSIPDVPGVQGWGRYMMVDGKVGIADARLPPTEATPYYTFVHVAYNLTTGKQLWVKNRTDIGYQAGFPSSLTLHVYSGEGVYIIFNHDTAQYICYDAYTGEKKWVSEPRENAWGLYYGPCVIAYGKFYAAAFDGEVYAFDLKTGKVLWRYWTGSSGFETPYGTWPFYGGITAADGKIFIGASEHSPDSPPFRGFRLHAINADTGEPVWNISGYFLNPVVADGYLITYNAYDNRIYCFGKGKTSVSLEAPLTAVPRGSSIVIRGKVTDESPAVAGTPCVADESMSGWMEYLVMQKPMPQNVKGVTVELYAIAEDGTSTKIGEATTDPLNGGIFSLVWTPPEEGKYIITAVFPGSKSYWDSCASTAIAVTAPPPEAATAEQAETMQSTLQSAIEAQQPLITALMVLVVIAIVISAYSIYDHRKLRK